VDENRIDYDALSDEATDGYLWLPIPDSRDERIRALVGWLWPSFGEGSALPLSPDEADVLACFAERTASLAVREKASERVEWGLRAVCLSESVAGHDEAGELVATAVLWRASELIGVDPAEVFGNVAAELGEVGRGDILRTFAARDPSDKSLETMRYLESEDEDDAFLFRADRAHWSLR